AIIEAGAAGGPAACAPDAETLDDLRLIADGLALAEQRDAEVLIRCAPTFAGVLSGTLADGMVEPPPLQDGGLLIVCGSYVSSTTRQLEHLRAQLGLEPIEPDLTALASDHPHAEVSRIARRVDRMLAAGRPALLSTPRTRPEGLLALDAGERIAYGLAAIVEALRRVPAVVIAKGGITSHVVLQEGLRALEGRIAGPVAAGVALWEVESRGRPLSYLVFPGNVGGPSHLTHVVELVTEA
ncbi:MAG: hypothetical protein JO179_01285, partial [Solirubrobacterales bacterium]|nr:hypothetical protein [Solirubrobacterales bacterium]